MKWFKHMSDMSVDAKVKRLIRKYGAEGYGMYCYILELIVRKLDTESPLPDLEESSKDIAGDLSMDTLRVEEIIWFCIEQGLFEQDELSGRIVAHKVYKYLQQSETRSAQIRAMIEAYKRGGSQTVSDSHRQIGTVIDKCEEQNRREENRTEESGQRTTKKSKVKTIQHQTLDVPIGETRYGNLCTDYGREYIDRRIEAAILWAEEKGVVVKDYAARVGTWILKDNIEKKRPHKVCPDCSKEYIGTLCVYCGYEEGKA